MSLFSLWSEFYKAVPLTPFVLVTAVRSHVLSVCVYMIVCAGANACFTFLLSGTKYLGNRLLYFRSQTFFLSLFSEN